MENNQEKKKEPSSKPSPEPDNTYARLSSITFELLALNLGIIGGGYFLDEYFATKMPWILLGAVLFSVVATIYYLLKKFGS